MYLVWKQFATSVVVIWQSVIGMKLNSKLVIALEMES